MLQFSSLSRVMDAQTISKNRASLKNLLNRKIFKSRKKFILIIFLFCLPFFAYAQSRNTIYKVLDTHSSMIREGENYVDFFKIYECPEKSADWLFDRLYAWCTSFNLIISSDRNSDVRRISIVNITTYRKKSNATYAKSSLNIDIRDERFRVTFSLVGVHASAGGFNHWYNPAKIYPQKKKVEMTNQTLIEYYHTFNLYTEWFNEIKDTLTEKEQIRDDW